MHCLFFIQGLLTLIILLMYSLIKPNASTSLANDAASLTFCNTTKVNNWNSHFLTENTDSYNYHTNLSYFLVARFDVNKGIYTTNLRRQCIAAQTRSSPAALLAELKISSEN